ncbi:unnamed protein product [Dicrocoelium dendriticum]|nr:unnamed protein product [Dicrocoelium dendriticum]
MSSISSFAFCVPVLLTMTSPLLVIESVQVLYFSTHVNLSTLLKHLNVTPVGFVGVFDTLYPGDHFSEYQIFAKYLKNTKEINVYHMLHTQDILPSENIFKKFNLSYIELPYYMLFHRVGSRRTFFNGLPKLLDYTYLCLVVSLLWMRLPTKQGVPTRSKSGGSYYPKSIISVPRNSTLTQISPSFIVL